METYISCDIAKSGGDKSVCVISQTNEDGVMLITDIYEVKPIPNEQ